MSFTFFRKGKKTAFAVLTTDHADLICKWLNDPEVTKYLGRTHPVTPVEEKAYLESLGKRITTDISFLILAKTKRSWKPIGIMSLHRINHLHGTAVTGAFIGEEKYRSGGYGSEAKILLLEYAFNWLNLRKIASHVYGSNPRSIAYSERCGYQVEGVLRAEKWHAGQLQDEVLMAIFRDDFELVHAFYQEHGRAPTRAELKNLKKTNQEN